MGTLKSTVGYKRCLTPSVGMCNRKMWTECHVFLTLSFPFTASLTSINRTGTLVWHIMNINTLSLNFWTFSHRVIMSVTLKSLNFFQESPPCWPCPPSSRVCRPPCRRCRMWRRSTSTCGLVSSSCSCRSLNTLQWITSPQLRRWRNSRKERSEISYIYSRWPGLNIIFKLNFALVWPF